LLLAGLAHPVAALAFIFLIIFNVGACNSSTCAVRSRSLSAAEVAAFGLAYPPVPALLPAILLALLLARLAHVVAALVFLILIALDAGAYSNSLSAAEVAAVGLAHPPGLPLLPAILLALLLAGLACPVASPTVFLIVSELES